MSHFTKDENSRRFVENLNFWLNFKENQKVAYNNLYRLCDYLENKLKEINPEKYKTFISENGLFERFNVNLAILIVNAITGKNELELLLNELFKRILILAELLGIIGVDKVIFEESDTNFGHMDIVWEGDIDFPPASDLKDGIEVDSVIDKSSSLIGGTLIDSYYNNDMDKGVIYNDDDKFNKALVIEEKYKQNKINKSEMKKYINISRCGYLKINKPNETDGPTLSMVLFTDNNTLYSNDNTKIERWINKYLKFQLTLIIVFNYFFPDGNIRIYLDHYMLKKFKTLPDNDALIITKKFDKFEYNEWDELIAGKVNILLKQFYDKLKSNENKKFSNALERFLFTYNLAGSSYNKDGTLEIREKTIDFFIYKFNGPFIENEGLFNEGHVTNGFIGQAVRLLPLIQKSYQYEDKLISRPKFIINRDAHVTLCSSNDVEYINQMIINSKNKKIFYNPEGYYYNTEWHDERDCIDNKIYFKKSLPQGLFNFANYTEDESMITNLEWLKSYGMAFIINKKNKLILIDHRKNWTDFSGKLIENVKYNYGLDEYLGSSFIETMKKNSIILPIQALIDEYFNNEKLAVFEYILMKYLYNPPNKIIKKKEYYKDLEKLRNMPIEEINKLPFDLQELLRLSLAFKQNKYNSWHTLFNTVRQGIDLTIHEDYLNKKFNVSEIINNLKEKYNFADELTLANFKLNCIYSIRKNPFIWCADIYEKTLKDMENKRCPPANYFSGFYNEIPPSLDIGIIRRPSDLKYAVQALENNNLKIPLNKSDYKLKVESEKLLKELIESNSIDNLSNGHIKPAIQNIILSFAENIEDFGISKVQSIAEQVSQLYGNLDTTQSNIWVPLIWRALNFNGFDIPPEWIKINIDFDDNNKYEIFNEKIKELSNINGWANYAIEVLLNSGNIVFSDNDNDFEAEIVKKLSSQFKESVKIKDFKEYRMETYIKYLKYKNKYLNLKLISNNL